MTSFLRPLTGVLALVAATASALAFPNAARVGPACVARVNKAALQAMNRINPIGQIFVVGDPTVLGPRTLRITVRIFGPRTEIYAVDVTIDDGCNVISASTRLETNDWPSR